MTKATVIIEFALNPGDYHGVSPQDEAQVRKLIKAMIAGEADWPKTLVIRTELREV